MYKIMWKKNYVYQVKNGLYDDDLYLIKNRNVICERYATEIHSCKYLMFMCIRMLTGLEVNQNV